MSKPVPAPIIPPTTACSPACPRPTRRAFWTKQFILWHWVSSAFALAAMIFFAFTGITLNHAGSISATPRVTQVKETLPANLLAQIAPVDGEAAETKRPLPTDVRRWLERNLDVNPGTRAFEWQEDEIYVDLPRPGGDGWLTISREDGAILKEVTTRGAIAWLNDLHKGRHTGGVWVAFMDFFSVVSIIFCLTGLGLLVVYARRRPMTWPVVIAGVFLPIFLILVFIHH